LGAMNCSAIPSATATADKDGGTGTTKKGPVVKLD
jgi:hypothetical protein